MLYISCIRLQKVLIALTMLSYKTDFGYSIGVRDPQVSILGMDFHLNWCSVRIFVLCLVLDA